MEVKKIKKIVEKSLNNSKANNTVFIDIRKKSFIADFIVISSGTSSRHLQSIADNISYELKKAGLDCRIEGRDSSDWKLVDAINIIIHLFHPDKRNFYDLEKMWSEPIPKEKAII